MTDVDIRPACLADVDDLAPRVRAAEVEEVYASHGLPAREALRESFVQSEEAYVLCFDGVVACMWGVQLVDMTFLGGRRGVVWMLTSDLVERHPVTFMRLSRAVLEDLLARWTELTNYIDMRYAKSLRWASKLGFVLDDPSPFGHCGIPFRRVRVRRENLSWA